MHGIQTFKEAGFLFANSFTGDANDGRAVVLFDLPPHGGRASDLVDDTGAICASGSIDPAQTILDPGDALAVSAAPPTTENLMMQIGTPDPVVPTDTQFRLATALDLVDPTASPPTPMTDRLQVFDFAGTDGAAEANLGGCHAFVARFVPPAGAPTALCGDDIVDAVCTTYGAQRQLAGFIASGGEVVPPRQPHAVGPTDFVGSELLCR